MAGWSHLNPPNSQLSLQVFYCDLRFMSGIRVFIYYKVVCYEALFVSRIKTGSGMIRTHYLHLAETFL